MSSFEQIPDEIRSDIFDSLPIGQCKCVQKIWNTIISDSFFIKKHFSNAKDTNNLLVVSLPRPRSLYSIQFNSDPTSGRIIGGYAYDLKIPCNKILGSSSGLVLIESYCSLIMCLNPTTKVSRKLPPYHDPHKRSVYGFAFDNTCGDHCVVKISWYMPNFQKKAYVSSCLLKQYKWDGVAVMDGFDFNVEGARSGILVDGSLHWLAKDEDDVLLITAYSVSAKELETVPAPGDVLNDPDFIDLALEVIHGCLGIVRTETFGGINLWVMKTYGAWTKLLFVLHPLAHLVPVACSEDSLVMVLNGNYILLVSDGKCVNYHPIDVLGSLPESFELGRTWIETLLPVENVV